jgi:hypothetical protein
MPIGKAYGHAIFTVLSLPCPLPVVFHETARLPEASSKENAMPVHWTISHSSRLVVAVAKDEVKAEDIEQYFAGVTADGAMAYRKIFEIAASPMTVSDEQLRMLGQRIMLYAQHGQVGPLALVASSDDCYAQARTFAEAAQARRPLQIFRELHIARRWLDEQAAVLDRDPLPGPG